MARKFGESGENLVQGAGRFGGSMGEMAPIRASGNIAPVKASGNMSRLDYADKLSNAKQMSKEVDNKTFGDKGPPKNLRDTELDTKVGNATNPDTMTSGAYKKGRLYNQDEFDYGMKKGGSVSSASKRADGCAKRGKTRA